MAWLYLLIASLGEVFGVVAINMYLHRKTLSRLMLIGLSFGGGFFFLSLALQEIPLGTAYAVWTGLGAAGAVLSGIIFFGESSDWKRLLFLSAIVIGAIGLRIME